MYWKNTWILALILGMCSFCFEAKGQIVAPDFVCVENDTLRWNIPTNTCGPFQNYTIYFSDNPSGPYSVLATVTDPSAEQFYHTNANSANNQWYYYIESMHNCPGLTSLSSDTLDNRDPDFPLIDAVTVIGNDVEILWTPSLAPETFGYIIYRKTANGSFEPLDTVYPGSANSFTDLNSDPNSISEEYTIVALDECGNTSIFNTEPQASILLDVNINSCTQTAEMTWNAYQNWTEGIAAYDIYVSVNGGIPIIGATADGAATSFGFDGLNDGDDYCFHVVAKREGTIFEAASNVICLTADIVQPNRNLAIQSVSFNDDDDIEIIWSWDTNAEINNVNINGSIDNIDYGSLSNFPPNLPLQNKDTTIITNHSASSGKQFFQVETRDLCDSVRISAYGSSIFITGFSTNFNTNEVQWTAFDFEFGEVLEYRLYKKTDLNTTAIAVLEPNELNFSDQVEPNNIFDDNACYYVEAYAVVELPNGTFAYTLSRSNTVCLEQIGTVRFPNAFAPNGANSIFKPAVGFPDVIANYELNIFDRWGKIVFTSSDWEIGWDGNINGSTARQGVYIYQMKMTQNNGNVVQKNGTVTLVR